MGNKPNYCDKEFLTDSPEPSTSTVVSFSGMIEWDGQRGPQFVNFLEISNCHEKARLHRTYEMTEEDWIDQVTRLRDHVNRYLKFLKNN